MTVTWTVEVNANPVTTGEFVVGSSLLGGSDVLSSDDRWVTIPARQVISIAVRRGGSEGFRAYNAGECVIVLDNTSGDFDPDNAAGLYVMGSVRLIRQGTGVRVRVNFTADATIGVNYVPNPSFEVDLSGWTGVRCTTARNTGGGFDGTAFIRGTVNDSLSAGFAQRVVTAQIAVDTGRPFTASAYMRAPAAWTGAVFVQTFDAGGSFIAQYNGAGVVMDPTNWQRVWVTTPVLPATVAFILIGLGRLSGTVNIGDLFDVDAAYLQTTDVMMFTGRIDQSTISGSWSTPQATWTCTDLLADLATVDVPEQADAAGDGDPSSVRAAWLLEQAGVPTSRRSIEAGGRALLGTTGGGTVRASLERVASGEAGRLYVSRTGLVTMTWHDAEYGKAVAVAWNNQNGIGPMYESIETSPGVVGIVNAAVVHRVVPKVRNPVTGQYSDGPNLPDAGAIDWDSVAVYGRRDVQVDVVLRDDADVTDLAGFLANRRSFATPRITRLVSAPLEAMTAAQAQTVLQLDLGDLVTLQSRTVDGRAQSWVATIEGINLNHDSPLTRATFATAPSDTHGLFGSAGWFVIGSSLLGGTAVLAPY